MKYEILGKSNIKVSRVGMGVLPIGPNQRALPLDEGASIIRYALDRGISFLDTAQYYKTYPYIREALKGNCYEPVISSKSLCVDYSSMEAAIDEARKSLNRDVIDIFLLHELRCGQFEERQGAWDCLQDAKAKGIIRACGISTHDLLVTSEMADVPECDVVFPLINYAGLGIRKGNGPGTADEMIESISRCHASGKGVFSMKAFGGGNLTANYQKALKYVLEKQEIDSVMIGFGEIKDIDDLFDYIDGRMSPDYNPDVSQKKMCIEQSDCEGCGTCLKICESEAIFYNENGLAQIDEGKCLTCGYCAAACPVRAIIMY